MSSYVFLNGKLLPAQDASIHFSDLAIQRGFAIFDFFRTQNGQAFLLEDHLDRFERSAMTLNLDLPYSRDTVRNSISELMDRHRYETAGIKLILTGGQSDDGLTPSHSNFIITIQPISFPDPEVYRKGVKLLTTEYRRDIPEVKTVNYAKVISMRRELEEAGAIDVLFSFQGELYETSRSNFFIVHDGIIKTQSQQILKGITRKTVMRLAHELGLKIQEGALRKEWLIDAEEAFITGTTKKVMPVVEVGGSPINDGVPGAITRKLGKSFTEFENKWSVLTQA